jgi:HK97 family phage major capsid protein
MPARPTLTVAGGRLVWNLDGHLVPYIAGGEGPTMTAEQEIADLRGEIARLESEAGEIKTGVDADRDRLRGEGVNLLRDVRFDEFDQRYREADEKKSEAAKLRGRLERALERMAAERANPPGPLAGIGGSGDGAQLSRHERRAFAQIARRYIQSDQYKRAREGGTFRTEGSRFSVGPVEVLERGGYDEESGTIDSPLIRALQDPRWRTTVNVGDAGAVVPIDQQVWPPIEIPVRQVRLLQLIQMLTTESDLVNYVQQSVRSDYAAETPYGTVAPEADYEFALKQASVKRLPQFIPATKDVLADQAELQGLLQEQLMTGVNLKLETQILSGGGSSPTDTQFQGMLNASGIGTVTYQGTGHTSEYQLDAYHRAITTIRLTLFADPSAVVVHPTDYEWAVLKRDAYGRYLFEPNTESAVPDLWGLNTVISPVIAQGTALVGDFRTAAKLWMRTGLSVTASTEYLDFFTRGMVAILAELRAAFAVVQPRALCSVTGLTGP